MHNKPTKFLGSVDRGQHIPSHSFIELDDKFSRNDACRHVLDLILHATWSKDIKMDQNKWKSTSFECNLQWQQEYDHFHSDV